LSDREPPHIRVCRREPSAMNGTGPAWRGASKQATILVVEDGDAVRGLVCKMLVQNGYSVIEAADGREALLLCEARIQPIDLVLADLIMPNMSGRELAYRLAHHRPDLRIVLMSGYTDEPIARSLGPDSPLFLPKPFTSVTLAEKIRQALDRPWNGLPLRGDASLPRKAGA
jgi:two-component system, cell cycle sensor histidine kinase and response regulator CckA